MRQKPMNQICTLMLFVRRSWRWKAIAVEGDRGRDLDHDWFSMTMRWLMLWSSYLAAPISLPRWISTLAIAISSPSVTEPSSRRSFTHILRSTQLEPSNMISRFRYDRPIEATQTPSSLLAVVPPLRHLCHHLLDRGRAKIVCEKSRERGREWVGI